MTFEVAAYTAGGTQRDRVALPGDLFDGTVNVPVMHQAVKAFLANQRQGNASTKTRGYVTGGNQKPWKQKGTGRARQGSTRAPHWVGGGTVFGPTPRSYAQYVPRQVRALARKSALNARARENAVIVIDRFEYDAPKTSRMLALVNSLGLAGQKVLVLTDGVKPNVFLSARNLPSTHVMPYADVSTYHILWSDAVLIEAPAIGQELEPIAETNPQPPAAAKKTAVKKTAARAEATDEQKAAKAKKTAAKKTAKSAAKKSTKAAAKKSAPKAKAAPKKTKATSAKKSAAKKSAPKKKGGK
ncbi:MAG TPA: 50S ribosomal protein L4 [Gemmatimonadaceae bacterium]|nr:50S ribosomal protein L4 [Gemmatimonadaceae bacterium]